VGGVKLGSIRETNTQAVGNGGELVARSGAIEEMTGATSVGNGRGAVRGGN
jgi:hypothetical protein